MNVAFARWWTQLAATVGPWSPWWSSFVDGLLKATLLLVAALLLDAVLRRWAVACVTMWNGVLIALVALVIAEAALPKTDLLRRFLPAATVEAEPAASADLDHALTRLVAAARSPEVGEAPMQQVAAPRPTVVAPVQGVAAPPPCTAPVDAPVVASVPAPPVAAWWFTPENGMAAVVAVYLIGWFIAAGRLVCALRAVARLRRASVPPTDGDWLRRLAKWSERLELRRPVELRASATVGVPLVVGARRPLVIVPVDVAERADGSARDAVLVHELTHVARNDYAWQLLFRVLQTILWFHPLIWIAGRRIHLVRERVCDAFSVHRLGSVEQYAEALLEMAGRLANRGALSLGLAVVRASKLGERLTAIYQHGGHGRYAASRWGRATVGVTAIGVAVALGHAAVAEVFAHEKVREVDEAAAIVARFEAEASRILEHVEAQSRARREAAIAQLQRLQDEYSRSAKLDEAVAIRERIRGLRGTPSVGSSPQLDTNERH